MVDIKKTNPQQIVQKLINNDPFSQWLGIKIMAADKGTCRLECIINKKMLNGYKVTHGGIVFSLADTALAFAVATLGRVSLAIDHSISFIKQTSEGDKITAEAQVMHSSFKTGVVSVKIMNSSGELIAFSKGTVYRKSNDFDFK